MTVCFCNFNVYQPGEDVAAEKADKKADDQDLIWHLFKCNLFIMVLFFLIFSLLLKRSFKRKHLEKST